MGCVDHDINIDKLLTSNIAIQGHKNNTILFLRVLIEKRFCFFINNTISKMPKNDRVYVPLLIPLLW